jgi:predicted Zn-dependent protease
LSPTGSVVETFQEELQAPRARFQNKALRRRGISNPKTPIIENDILKNYLYDTYAALQDNVESTGNANKGIGHWPRPQSTPSKLILKPEKTPSEEIIQATEKGL